MQGLSREAEQTRREYYREYRRKNRARIRDNNRKYWERKAARKERSVSE